MEWTIGGVASIGAGSGLVNRGTASEPRLAVNPAEVQTRVTSSCERGSAITSIAQDGSVACAACQCAPAPGVEAHSGFLDEASMDYVEFPGKVITGLPLPAGKWVVWAKADILPHVNASGSFGCRIIVGADVDNASSSWWYQSLDNGYGNLDTFIPQSIALNVVHELTNDNEAVFQCFTNAIRDVDGAPYPLILNNIKITAIRADTLTNKALTQIK